MSVCDYLFKSPAIKSKQQFINRLKIKVMKKLAIVFAMVLGSIGLVSAQSRSSYSSFSNAPDVSSSIFSTPKVTNYNTTYKSQDSYLSNQSYRTPTTYTTVNTTRTSLGNNNYLSGTDVFSNGSRRSSSRTTSIDFGQTRMTTTQYFDGNGNVKKSRTRTNNYGW